MVSSHQLPSWWLLLAVTGTIGLPTHSLLTHCHDPSLSCLTDRLLVTVENSFFFSLSFREHVGGAAYLYLDSWYECFPFIYNRLLQCSRLGITRNFRRYQITFWSTARTSLRSVCNVIHLMVQRQLSFYNTHSYKMEFPLRNLYLLILWNIWLTSWQPEYYYSHLNLQLKTVFTSVHFFCFYNCMHQKLIC